MELDGHLAIDDDFVIERHPAPVLASVAAP